MNARAEEQSCDNQAQDCHLSVALLNAVQIER